MIRTSWTTSNPGRRFHCCSRTVSVQLGKVMGFDHVNLFVGWNNHWIRVRLILSKKNIEEAYALAVEESRKLKIILAFSWISFICIVSILSPFFKQFHLRNLFLQRLSVLDLEISFRKLFFNVFLSFRTNLRGKYATEPRAVVTEPLADITEPLGCLLLQSQSKERPCDGLVRTSASCSHKPLTPPQSLCPFSF
ncbi:hypothetical protein OSB04_006405 [Centaurea solstitialis]|uniref:Uncharacterized protein n=1 Tax=Centaurea solstitialis TaxID=347529 RepID=A0AA38WQA3_9ASTR|nr:hypothetical protein OSB04_006405 [Centaurea solstitialis]